MNTMVALSSANVLYSLGSATVLMTKYEVGKYKLRKIPFFLFPTKMKSTEYDHFLDFQKT